MNENLLVQDKFGRSTIQPGEAGLTGLVMAGRANFTHSSKEGLSLHHHDGCIEILYLDKGRQRYYAQGKYHHIAGGDVFIAFPHEEHGTGGFPEEKTTFYWMQAQLDLPEGFLCLPPALAESLRQQLMQMKTRVFKGSPALKRYCNQLIHAFTQKQDPLRLLRMQQAAISFMLEIIDLEKKQYTTEIDPDIQKVLGFIAQHPSSPVDIPALAKMCYCSESHFRNRFKQQLGVPPREYILRNKIERSKKMLEKGWSITRVAQEAGIPSVSYFSTLFKKYTALSPREYQLAHQLQKPV